MDSRHAPHPAWPRQSFRQRGMTLVEVLAVVVILGMLATVLAVSFRGQIGRARHEIARTNIGMIVQSIETYAIETGHLPDSEQGLKALTQLRPGGGEPYLKADKLIDPWGQEFIYMNPGPDGSGYVVMSYGADQQAGGEPGSENADISSDNLGGQSE